MISYPHLQSQKFQVFFYYFLNLFYNFFNKFIFKKIGNNSRIQSLISKLAENQKDTPFPPKKFVTVKEKLKAEADKVNAEKSKSTSPKESPPKELSPKETPVKELLLKESQPRKSPSPKESISKLIEIKKTIKEQSPTKENILVIHTIVSLSPDRELYSKENLLSKNIFIFKF